MSHLGPVLLVASLSSFGHGGPDRAPSIERIVVVLGENDPVVSSRVLRQMESCMDGAPTAVVSAFGEFRVMQDFTTDRDAVLAAIDRPASAQVAPSRAAADGFSLAARVKPESAPKSRDLAASLCLLAEALAPVGPTTAVVLVSPQFGAAPGTRVQTGAGMSPENRSTEGETASTTDPGSATVTIPRTVIEARRALREAGVTLVAVNTSGPYDAGAKALTEIPGGRYLRASQKKFSEALVSAVCAPGR